MKEFLKSKISEIEKELDRYTKIKNNRQSEIYDAMRYSVMAGGKRLRPVIMLLSCEMCGGTDKDVMPFACALEMIHTYSLIHDDLPALDNDDYRRGRKTSHVVFGEAMAILAGDALLNYAYETACKAFAMDTDVKKVADAMCILASKPGIYGMIGGQVVDVEMTGRTLSREQLEYVYENKTGALIEASMMIGATLAGADASQLEKIRRIASDVGMAFQIQDDILDICGDSALLGKPTRSDEENGKVTYVTIHGIDESSKYVNMLSERAVKGLEEIGGDYGFLKELIVWLIHRDR